MDASCGVELHEKPGSQDGSIRLQGVPSVTWQFPQGRWLAGGISTGVRPAKEGSQRAWVATDGWQDIKAGADVGKTPRQQSDPRTPARGQPGFCSPATATLKAVSTGPMASLKPRRPFEARAMARPLHWCRRLPLSARTARPHAPARSNCKRCRLKPSFRMEYSTRASTGSSLFQAAAACTASVFFGPTLLSTPRSGACARKCRAICGLKIDWLSRTFFTRPLLQGAACKNSDA